MIVRIWHGVTLQEKADDYYDYIMRTGVKFYRSREGNRGVYVLRQLKGGKADFLILSLWETFESIRKFAGPDINKAVYHFPKDKTYLLELEPFVRHYEVLAAFANHQDQQISPD